MPHKITNVERWVLPASIAQPVANAFGAMTDRPALFPRISAGDCAWGWGEVFCNFPQVGAEHRSYMEVDANPNPNPLREEVFPLDIVHGRVTLSDAPRLGVAPDLRRLDRFIVPTT